MLLNSIETLHHSDSPQVHELTAAARRPDARLSDRLQALQHPPCVRTAPPQGVGVSPGTWWARVLLSPAPPPHTPPPSPITGVY